MSTPNPRKGLVPLGAGALADGDLYDAVRDRGGSHEDAVAAVESRKASVTSQGAGRSWEPNVKPNTAGVATPLKRLGQAAHAFTQNASLNFADEIEAGVEHLIPGGPDYSEAKERAQADYAAIPAKVRVPSAIAGALTSVAASAPLGVIKGSAALGGIEAAGRAEGVEKKVLLAPVGAGIGALLGKGGELLGRLGGRRAATILGGGVGAATGDGAYDRAENAAIGATGVNLAARAGGKVAAAVSRNPSATRALGKLTQALEREGLDESKISAMAADNVPGTNIVNAGKPGGSIQRLARAAESIPGEGSQQIRGTLGKQGALEPSRAEKAARRALGSRFKPPPPESVKDARKAISSEARPAYAELRGKTVSGEKLFELFNDEPVARDIWNRARELSAKRAKAGFDDAEELPELFKASEDGMVGFTQQEVPVLGLDMMKRALRSVVDRSRNSANPIDAEEATILGKRLEDIIETAKQESPEYAKALSTFAKAAEKQTSGLAKQKQSADFVLGNSQTMRIAKDQEDFGGGLSLSDMNLGNILERLGDAALERQFRNMDEATVNALAPYLTKPLAEGGADDLIRALREFAEREARAGRRIGDATRAGSLTAGSLAGSASRDKRD
jgi:hypothetical protein